MSQHSRTIKGTKISAGIAIGKSVVISQAIRDITRKIISPDDIQAEQERFTSAVRLIIEQTDRLISSMSPKELKKIGPHLNVQKMILSDLRFIEDVHKTISAELVNGEVAIIRSLEKYVKLLNSREKMSINARSVDLKSIEFLLLRVLSGKIKDISLLNEEHILIAHDLTPVEIYFYSKQNAIGIALETGGRNSHTAIVARSLHIPAVIGISNLTQIVNTLDEVIIDGLNGLLIIHPSQRQIKEYARRRVAFCTVVGSPSPSSQEGFFSSDGTRIFISANIDFPEEVDAAKALGADGIGLLRTEFYFIERPRTPSEEEQFYSYNSIAEKFYPKEVTIRTLDVGGDKIPGFLSQQKGENPALGIRAIRFCLKNRSLFISQIKAILRSSYRGNVRILIPMVSSVEEIIETRKIIEEAKQILKEENRQFDSHIKVGIMLEIPSIIFIMDEISKYIDFFSLGTNDLIQFTMAVDRGNIELFDSVSSMEPAILRILRLIKENADRLNKPIYVCGEMASEIENIIVLIGLGYRHLSMSPINIPLLQNTLKTIDVHKAEQLTEGLLKRVTQKEIQSEIERFINEQMQ